MKELKSCCTHLVSEVEWQLRKPVNTTHIFVYLLSLHQIHSTCRYMYIDNDNKIMNHYVVVDNQHFLVLCSHTLHATEQKEDKPSREKSAIVLGLLSDTDTLM